MCILYFVLAVEEIAKTHLLKGETNCAWRDQLMTLFFEGISKEGMQFVRENSETGDVCDSWNGVTCFEESVVRIEYQHLEHGDFNPNVLPHTLLSLRLFNCQQKFRLLLRLLPRRLVGVSLRGNMICGRIDLRDLPPLIEIVNLSQNSLTGQIDLTCLPKSLRKVDLSCNLFQQRTVFYSSLPPNIVLIRLRTSHETNKFHNIRALHEEDRAQGKLLFE